MEEIKTFTKEVIKTVAEDNSYTIGADQTIYGACPKCEKGKVIETPKPTVAVDGSLIIVRLLFGKKWLKRK